MRIIIVTTLALFALAATVGGCGSDSCSTQADCPVGFYCVRSFGGGSTEGACEQDCASSADCEQPASSASRAVCTNEGRCRVEAVPPRLVVLEPEPDVMFAEGTRQVRVAGEVEMASEEATVIVTTTGNRGCGSDISRQVTITNDSGAYSAVPFVIDQVDVDPGTTVLRVEAVFSGDEKMNEVPISVACPDCATITITAPSSNATGTGLRLSTLQGVVDTRIDAAIWRVRGPGGVLDGTLPMNADGTRFEAADLPLFPGGNRVEVIVTGVGSGQGESRCSVSVNAGVSAESGLRAILTWDGATSDLDLHLVGPGGAYGDPASTLSSRTRNPAGFVGTIADDFDGLGPEVISVPNLPDGEYGLVVEAVYDSEESGSTAYLRLLYDGQTLTTGPIGPRYIKAQAGDLWVAGVLEVSSGQAAFRVVDERASATLPPTTPPGMWPTLY